MQRSCMFCADASLDLKWDLIGPRVQPIGQVVYYANYFKFFMRALQVRGQQPGASLDAGSDFVCDESVSRFSLFELHGM